MEDINSSMGVSSYGAAVGTIEGAAPNMADGGGRKVPTYLFCKGSLPWPALGLGFRLPSASRQPQTCPVQQNDKPAMAMCIAIGVAWRGMCACVVGVRRAGEPSNCWPISRAASWSREQHRQTATLDNGTGTRERTTGVTSIITGSRAWQAHSRILTAPKCLLYPLHSVDR